MERLTFKTAAEIENWLFLAQPAPFPETMINAMPEFYLDHILSGGSGDDVISAEARSEYLRCFNNPRVIKSICEEYRASETDMQHDRIDRANGKRIACPVLLLWDEKDLLNPSATR